MFFVAGLGEDRVGFGVAPFDFALGSGGCGIPKVIGKGFDVPCGVGEFEDAGGDVVDVVLAVAIGWEDGELFDDEGVKVNSAKLLTGYIVENNTIKIRNETTNYLRIF